MKFIPSNTFMGAGSGILWTTADSFCIVVSATSSLSKTLTGVSIIPEAVTSLVLGCCLWG